MKVLSSKWVAIVVPIAGVLGAVASVIWADDEVRLKMVTALGVLVLTRYVIRWIYQYGQLLAKQEKLATQYDRLERALVWLFQMNLTDTNERGERHKPFHIKLDNHDLRILSGETQRALDYRTQRKAPAEVPEWWLRRMP